MPKIPDIIAPSARGICTSASATSTLRIWFRMVSSLSESRSSVLSISFSSSSMRSMRSSMSIAEASMTNSARCPIMRLSASCSSSCSMLATSSMAMRSSLSCRRFSKTSSISCTTLLSLLASPLCCLVISSARRLVFFVTSSSARASSISVLSTRCCSMRTAALSSRSIARRPNGSTLASLARSGAIILASALLLRVTLKGSPMPVPSSSAPSAFISTSDFRPGGDSSPARPDAGRSEEKERPGLAPTRPSPRLLSRRRGVPVCSASGSGPFSASRRASSAACFRKSTSCRYSGGRFFGMVSELPATSGEESRGGGCR
mmetsp:Transcript_2642/g.10559  ORF Transcript_2642/g.10559 Transcript_2642/m.10559 type:complete len:318 (+) Transcript_2642:273-1226(+)